MFRQLAVAIEDASEAQAKALAITPKIVAILSLIGSSILIYDIVSNGRFRKKLYHSILLGMSITDALCSFAFFFTTWPIPPEVLPVWGASGTQLTCTVQGWFTQFSISAIFYSGFLAFHYLLVIRMGWTERRLRDARLALIIHLCSISVGVLTSSISAGLGLLNPIGWDCWIASVPLGCAESWQNEQTTCTRGDNANLFQWLFFYGPLWVTIVFVTIVMYLVYSSYIQNFRKAARWNVTSVIIKHRSRAQSGVDPTTPSAPSRQEREKSLMKTQMMLYVGSFYLVWLFPTILRFTELFGDTVWYHWVFLSACSVPSQGKKKCNDQFYVEIRFCLTFLSVYYRNF